jgi:hypothetical protein
VTAWFVGNNIDLKKGEKGISKVRGERNREGETKTEWNERSGTK